jgi:hypothetical protein
MKLPQCEAQKLYLTLQKMRTDSKNHIVFSANSQLSKLHLEKLTAPQVAINELDSKSKPAGRCL